VKVGGARLRAPDGSVDGATGADGTLTVTAPEGSLLEATHESYGFGRGIVGAALQMTIVVDAAPVPRGTMRGEVADATGHGMPGIEVVAEPTVGERGRPRPALRARTDGDGRFVIGDTESGTYQVSALGPTGVATEYRVPSEA